MQKFKGERELEIIFSKTLAYWLILKTPQATALTKTVKIRRITNIAYSKRGPGFETQYK